MKKRLKILMYIFAFFAFSFSLVSNIVLITKVYEIDKYVCKNQRIIDSSYYENVKFMRNHLSECSFITRKDIVSVNGRFLKLKNNYR